MTRSAAAPRPPPPRPPPPRGPGPSRGPPEAPPEAAEAAEMKASMAAAGDAETETATAAATAARARTTTTGSGAAGQRRGSLGARPSWSPRLGADRAAGEAGPELLLGDDDAGAEPASLLAHEMEVKTFTKPTKCAACNKILIGVRKQGLACKRCNAAAHRKCAQALEAAQPCQPDAQASPLRSPAGQATETWMLGPAEHELAVKTFTKPTKCAICNEILLGVFKQGLECRGCKSPVHRKCADRLAGSICTGPPPPSSARQRQRKPLLNIDAPVEDVSEELPASCFSTSEGSPASTASSSFDAIAASLPSDPAPLPIERHLDDVRARVAQLDLLVAAERMSSRFAAVDNTIEEAFNNANAKIQMRLEAMERNGVANTITQGIRAQTRRAVAAMETLSRESQKQKSRETPLVVDPSTLEAAEFVGSAAQTVGSASVRTMGFVRDAAAAGIERLSKTELARAFEKETDPEMRRALADGVAGLSMITNQVWDSVGEVGSAAGRSIVDSTAHTYGPDAGRLAQASTNVVGGGYNTLTAGGGLLSGAHFVKAPFRTADRWALREPVTFNGNMYEAVYDYLGYEKRGARVPWGIL